MRGLYRADWAHNSKKLGSSRLYFYGLPVLGISRGDGGGETRGHIGHRGRRGPRGEDGPLKVLGRHLLIEYYECDVEILNDMAQIEEAMTEAARRTGATIVNSIFHFFNPHGISGVVVIAESHMAIHTWPEYAFAAVDLFSCGEGLDPDQAVTYLRERFRARSQKVQEIPRGTLGAGGKTLSYKPDVLSAR